MQTLPGSRDPVFYRTYSRRTETGGRESWAEVCDRTCSAIAKLGGLSTDETMLIARMQRDYKSLPSGRWLWIGGSDWIEKGINYPGAYNCTSTNVVDWRAFGLMMDLSMMGCGTGAVLEPKYINQLPLIRQHLDVRMIGEIGTTPAAVRRDQTFVKIEGDRVYMHVGDSRQGWVKSYQTLLELSSDERFTGVVICDIDLNDVRGSGEPLLGFGGVANPVKLPELYGKCAAILNAAVGRQLNSLECCLLIDEAAVVVVAGNVRRSAGMRQGSTVDRAFQNAKANLWQQDDFGNWRIDSHRDALRMANHTSVFHFRPTLEECVDSVRRQYESGEGAIQYAPEALARASVDLLPTVASKRAFINLYEMSYTSAKKHLSDLYEDEYKANIPPDEIDHRMQRYGTNPCGEILGSDFFCNLSEIHLNQLDPMDRELQQNAFTAASLSAAALLHHKFVEERYQISRELDPIVGVSFTGLFDFFVNAFGVDWLRWWEAGRPSSWGATFAGESSPAKLAWVRGRTTLHYASDFFTYKEQEFLSSWREIVHRVVWDYCDRHGLKRPNRCTTVQPAGTKSLLTGASPGWHPPKSQWFIRRITFAKNDPVALACIDFGYSVVPGHSDKDELGNLLNDPWDERCTEWLVEIPTAVPWADLPGVEEINISQFSALAQFDFYMQVQQYYTTHNTSATIELRSHEIEAVGNRIYEAIQNNEGYVSATLLARYDDHQTFPRLPFEPVSKQRYQELVDEVKARRKTDDFHAALALYDSGGFSVAGPSGCDSDKCLFPSPAT